MKVTFFGTTTLLFDDGKDQVLFDAHFTRPSLPRYIFGSGRTDEKLADELLRRHHVDRLRAIFVSHSHHDHVMDAPFIANRCKAVIYGTESALNVGRGGGVPEDRLILYHDGETYCIGDFRITVIKSLHSKPTILNNDLGEVIDRPLVQPARLRDYKEGGSFDFLVETPGKTYLIRPSFNYIEGQLDNIRADVLFLGVAGLGNADEAMEKKFFMETARKVGAKLIIPIHWDNFFSRLDRPIKGMPRFVEKTEVTLFKLARYCGARGIGCVLQLPGTCMEV